VNGTAIVCTLPSDAHTWNLVVVAERLKDLGMTVTNLGSCIPFDELVDRVLHAPPALLVVSSINGHGEVEAHQLIYSLSKAGLLSRTRAVIGGKLALSREQEQALTPALLKAGYAGVYTGHDSWSAFLVDLPRLLTVAVPREQDLTADLVAA
jgi:methylaspartate mutase sigma subunit